MRKIVLIILGIMLANNAFAVSDSQPAVSMKQQQEDMLNAQKVLFDRAQKHSDRQEKMLEQGEKDQARFQKILDKWEAQQAQYQKYLDSLPTSKGAQ